MKWINFDHLACSRILPEVKEAMMPFLSEDMGNPLSSHMFGNRPKEAVMLARTDVAEFIGCSPEEIIFTSCGSESNNLAIKGIASAYMKKGRHIISSPVEHHSVIHPLKRLEKDGYELSWLKVDSNGKVSPDEVESLIRNDTILVSVTAASNEIGTLEPIMDIGRITRKKGILLHTDAVAAVGSVPLDVNELGVDLLSMSANVFYGPPGAGALYIRKGVRVLPLIEGGIQEKGLRAGTHNVAGIVGMGVAARAAKDRLAERKNYLLNLREKLINGILEKVGDSFLTGDRQNRLPYHASFCIKFIEGESILLHLNFAGIAGTSGSTCSSEALKVSHVLEAIGVDPVWAQGSIVFSLGIDNSIEDVELFMEELPQIVNRLRMMSPLASPEDISKFRQNPH